MAHELASLGCQDIRPGYKGVYVHSASMRDVYAINYRSRLATRVLLPIAKFTCHNREGLYQAARNINWSQYLQLDRTFAIDANVAHPALKNSLFAAMVVKDAICDQFREKTGSRPDVDIKEPDLQINLFVRDRTGIISIDTSGVPLSKRGYRQDSGEAPLQESLAAALLAIAQYTGQEIVFDPCCGSGTLLIEAALIASRTAPGFLRRDWGFMQLPGFSQSDWLKVKNEADALRTQLPAGHLFGCDKDARVVEACRANLKAAGLQKEIQVAQADFRQFTPNPAPNFIISNPPHGKRLENVADLVPLYRALGEFMKTKCAKPARGFIFTGSLELAKQCGLAPKKRHVVSNSGVDSRLLEFDLY